MTHKSLEERVRQRREGDDHFDINDCCDEIRQELQALRDKVVSRKKIRGVLSLGFLIGAQSMINEILIDIDEAMK